MKKMNWKYMLAGLVLVGISACSNESEGTPFEEKTEVSRSTITLERTVTLTEAGTLEAKVTEAMGDEKVENLQKLVLSGPFNGTDVQYWKTHLTGLIEFDMANAVPTYTEGQNTYKDKNGNDMYLNENWVGPHMLSYMTALEKVILPTCATYVDYEACQGCKSLIEVVIPEKVTNMAWGIFSGCSSLTTVSLPENLGSINSTTFQNCTSLSAIKIPESVESIGWSAFYGCTALKEVNIPSSVMRIDDGAFRNCAFTSVEIPATVTGLSSWVFAENKALEEVKILAQLEEIPSYSFYNCPALEKVEYPSTVKAIRYGAFEGTALKSVDLSKMAILEASAFASCKNLESVVLPDTITTLAESVFRDCEALEEVKFPASLEVIGEYAFGRSGLKNVAIPEKVHTIKNHAFRETQLTALDIPANVKSIGYESFWDIETLETVTLNEGLEKIGERALGYNLVQSFTIPSTVTEIGNEAFRSTKIEVLTVPASVKTTGGSLINDCSELRALVWNTTAELRDSWGVNENCYLYLADGTTPYGPNWRNIVVNGVAESIKLCEGGGNTSNPFSIPIAFKAKKITFERNFDSWKWTYPGKSAGWQTLVLPFTPTKIEHETKGVAAPFNSGVEGAKPFWLRTLTADGFVDKTKIEPNVPYIIAMPNNDEYLEEYRLYGKITFSAENVELAVTPDTLAPAVGPDYMLQPTYRYVQSGPEVYALNDDYWIRDYDYGSVFARSSADVYTFQAYVVLDGRSSRSVFEMTTRSKESRTPYTRNKTGIPQIGDM